MTATCNQTWLPDRRSLIVPPGDDGMLEIQWASDHLETVPLESLLHIEGFNKMFGIWRKVSWPKSGNIVGLEPRDIPVLATLPSGGLDPFSKKALAKTMPTPQLKTVERLAKEKRSVLRHFAQWGTLAEACRRAGVNRALFQSQVLKEQSVHYDAGWIAEYESLKRRRPWKNPQQIAATG